MVNAAVAEPETPSPENEVVNPGATPEGEGTGETQPTSQAIQSQESSSTPAPVDPSDAVVAARIKLAVTQQAGREGIQGDFNTFEELDVAREQRRTEAREAERDAQSKTFFRDTLRKIDENLANHAFKGYDENGNETEFRLTPEQRQEFVHNHLGNLRGQMREYDQQENFDELAEAALELIPKEGHEAYLEKVDGKELAFKPWLGHVIEAGAPSTQAWKEREAQFQLEKAEYGKQQWEEGNKAPPGQPSQQGGGVSTGLPTPDQWYRMTLEQREERRKADPDIEVKMMGLA